MGSDRQWNSPVGNATRRSILKSAGAALLASGPASLIAAGPARAATTQARRGGDFRIGVGAGATSDSLDPATYVDTFMQTFGHSLHGYLTEVDANGDLVGELAESWEPSKDAKTWHFKLRRGVEFHNGKSVTPDDVIASLNHHRGESSKSAAKAIVEPIREMRVDGPDSIVFVLDGGKADFPFLLEDYHLAILPSRDGQADVGGVGAGGYVLDAVDFGVKGRSTRFKNYWKPNAAWFDTFEVLSIHDVAARTNALSTGQIHAMDRCDLKTIRLLERNGAIEIVSTAGTQHYTAPMLVDVAPFTDQNVRLALKYGIDRKQMLDLVLRGYGQIGNDHPISSSNKYFARDLPQREYDPDKARYHLRQAGQPDLRVSLSASEAAFSGAVDLAAIYQQQASKAGIQIDLIREPSDGYWSNVWMKKPWCMCYWSGRPTADWMFSQVYAAGASWNDTHWRNDRFNALLREASAELDEARRANLYGEMQAICRDDGGAVVPLFANYVNALSRKVGHGAIGSNWDLDGHRSAERWWFA